MVEEKKFVESYDTNDWEIMTDTGWQDIVKIHMTIPYEIWEIKTVNHSLKCADKHLVFDKEMNPTFVEELKNGDQIWTDNGLETVISIVRTSVYENMYDAELDDYNHRYYTDGILSHNTITSAIYLLWYAMMYDHKEILICAQSKDAAMENLSKIAMSYEYCPNFLKKGLVANNKSSLVFDNGSRIVVRAASVKAPRGLSPAIVYVDEFAFIGNQKSGENALQAQEDFYGALSPTLSATKGKLFITTTPISETDLFYRLWNGGIKKTDTNGMDLPKDYIVSVNGELYRDFNLFKTEKEADSYVRRLRANEAMIAGSKKKNKNHIKYKVVSKEPIGSNTFQTQLVTWKDCPLKDQEWADAELKKVGPSFFAKEYNCIDGDTIVKIMDEKGEVFQTPVKNLYDFY